MTYLQRSTNSVQPYSMLPDRSLLLSSWLCIIFLYFFFHPFFLNLLRTCVHTFMLCMYIPLLQCSSLYRHEGKVVYLLYFVITQYLETLDLLDTLSNVSNEHPNTFALELIPYREYNTHQLSREHRATT